MDKMLDLAIRQRAEVDAAIVAAARKDTEAVERRQRQEQLGLANQQRATNL